MDIQTKSGTVRGNKTDGCYQFFGIPYAKSERFQDPKEYFWSGILDATKYGESSLQDSEGEVIGGENCLNLNILTPNVKGKLPVLIEIHGGAFQTGNNQNMMNNLIKKRNNFVYVSINYRLGILGFLYLGMSLGKEYKYTGNLGILDQMQALKWIKENISAFGGDSEQITLMGNSAGAKSIGALMLSHYSNKLFHQVILSSGGVQAIRSIETAEIITKRLLNKAGIDDVKILLKANNKEIIEMQKVMCSNEASTCFFGPVVDGNVIPDNWKEDICGSNGWHGRAVIGSNLNECVWLKENHNLLSEIDNILNSLFGINDKYAKEAWKYLVSTNQTDDEKKKDYWVKVVSDFMYRTHANRLAEILREKGERVWEYSFEYLPASHALDIDILSGDFERKHTEFVREERKELEQLRKVMEDFYIQFITSGNPNGYSVPKWNCNTKEKQYKLILDRQCTMREVLTDDCLNQFPDYSIE